MVIGKEGRRPSSVVELRVSQVGADEADNEANARAYHDPLAKRSGKTKEKSDAGGLTKFSGPSYSLFVFACKGYCEF